MGPRPPVLVLRHFRENRRKCTVTPIEGRPGIEVQVLRPGASGYGSMDLGGGILLAVGAPPLVPADRAHLAAPGARLILIDCNWARVGRLLPVFADRGPLARRSIPAEVQTAYPRRSKVFEDPAGGLATIEAIVAALAILGWPEPSLLDGFHWAGEFLERNRFLFGGLESSAVRAGRLAGGEGASPV